MRLRRERQGADDAAAEDVAEASVEETLSELEGEGDDSPLDPRASAGSPRKEKELQLLDDGEDTDHDFRRAYIEEVHRQIKKDTSVAPDRAAVEKVLRLKQRFRVNRQRSTWRQFATLSQMVSSYIIALTEQVRKKLANPVR